MEIRFHCKICFDYILSDDGQASLNRLSLEDLQEDAVGTRSDAVISTEVSQPRGNPSSPNPVFETVLTAPAKVAQSEAQLDFLKSIFNRYLPMSSLAQQSRIISLAADLVKFRPSVAAGASFLHILKSDLENWMFGVHGTNAEYLSLALMEADDVYSTELKELEVNQSSFCF